LLPRERKYTGCSSPTERATPVAKRNPEKRQNNGNASLPSVYIHLFVDSGPKRAKILNFDALFFMNKGLGSFFFFTFFVIVEMGGRRMRFAYIRRPFAF
jgi:hypothetical protein